MREEHKMNNDLLEAVKANALFVFEFLIIIAATFVIAYLFDKAARKRRHDNSKALNTRAIAVIGVFSAIAAVLHMIDFPVGFAPAFYKLDFGDLPALIGGFAFGPLAGAMIEAVKILLKLLFKGTSTAFVGDLANFVVGCAFVIPATVIYDFKKTKKTALIACICGIAVLTLAGTVFNALYLIPAFSKLYGIPVEGIIDMGTAINPAIDSVWKLCLICVAPLNILKGALDSAITVLIYKRISPILKGQRSASTKS